MLLFASTSFAQTSKNDSTPPSSFYVGAAVALNAFAVTGIESYHETKIKHAVPASPVFVVGAKLYTDNKASRFFLAPRINVYSFSAKGEVDLTSGLAKFHHASSYQSKIIVSPFAGAGYHVLNSAALKWHVSAGVGFNFLFNRRELQTTTYANGTQKVIDHRPEPMVFVFGLGTGIDVGKQATIWMNYQPPADISKYMSKKSKLSSLQIGVSWSFKN